MGKLIVLFVCILAVLIFVFGLGATTNYYANLPEHISQHETIVLGENRFVPGSKAALRILVRDTKDASPLPDAEIKISMAPAGGGQPVTLFEGKTDALGTTNVSFKVPDSPETSQNLVVETKSSLGSDRLEQPVTLVRDYRVLLTTDKPLYQPGQMIHLRALALSAFDLTPAVSQELEVSIADGKGNRVFRKKLSTSEFGVAATDFQLASEVNTGAYKITAILGNTSSEKTVSVEHYVLPKFGVKLSTERPYYLPGQLVQSNLSANYFFGKPVSGGSVVIEGYTFDVERTQVFSLQGTTDVQGNFEFEFNLPGYIAGSDLEGGLGRFYVQAAVTDLAGHSETSNLSLPVAQNALVIEAIPEGGQFIPGVDNILYVLTSYPDGTPAQCSLSVSFPNDNQNLTVNTDPYGVAEVHVTPLQSYEYVVFNAQDDRGNTAFREMYFEGSYYGEPVLLRPDKPVYRVGETMKLSLFTSQTKGTVYLDIVRSRQTVSTRSIDVTGGKAEVAVDLTPDLFGTLELNAYKIMGDGQIVRDSRVVVVNNADDLGIALKLLCPPEKENAEVGCVYLPGENAALDIQVNGTDGSGAQSVLGLAIVDESVFALAEQDPGFAKLYFMLEQELLVPKYDLHGFSVPDLVSPTKLEGAVESDPQLRSAVAKAATASLAAAALPAGFSLEANSHYQAIARAGQIQVKYFSILSKGLYVFFLLIPLVLVGLVVYGLVKEKRFGRSLLLAVGLLILVFAVFMFWPLGPNYDWAKGPISRLGVMIDYFQWGKGMWVLVTWLLLAAAGYLALVVYAIVKKDGRLGAILGGLLLFILALIGIAYATPKANINPSDLVIVLGLVAFVLIPLLFLLRSSSDFWAKRFLPAASGLVVSSFLLIGIWTSVSMVSYRSAMLSPQGVLGGQEVIKEVEVVKEVAVMAAPMATAAPAAMEDKGERASTTTAAGEPPRLRQYFPETMLWLPEAVTDPNGYLHLEFPVADSITTWRMTALASSKDGRLGSVTGPLRVFQDFFIDLDLPVALTVGDEVAVPVGVFNYLPEEQIVRLELEKAEWFDLLDEPVKEMTIAANDIQVVYFRVKANDFGQGAFKVTAYGSKMSDAILKQVRVYPNGKQIPFTYSDRLVVGTPLRQSVLIPQDALPGTQTLLVKIYPGILSQVVEGLDSILRMPYGCFEQTSSTTYPNVLVLDYLKTTNQASPEVQFKAEEYINLGYQRLTTFEVKSSGGFSLFGDEPADRMLTAYGLQEFADMSRVRDVDPALIERAARWLLSQQDGDGSWANDRGLVHEDTWQQLGNAKLPVTAYIAWSLVEAGYGSEAGTQNGLRYVREHLSDAQDPYVLALVANALVSADLNAEGKLGAPAKDVLERLAGLARQEGSGVYWQSGVATFMGSEGKTGSIETTALAALALLRGNVHPELANAALGYLVRQKDNFGTWYNTQATVLTLKAMIRSVRAGAENVNATVTVTLNGSQQRTLQVTAENFDVVQMLSFSDVNIGKENVVDIRVEGEGNLMYQVSGGYYLPWDKLVLYPELAGIGQELVSIDVKYDRTELTVNDTVQVNVTVSLNQPGGKAESALIDLGLPPGFTVQAEDLAALVAYYNDTPEDYAFPKIERFELTGRQIMIYLSNLSAGNTLQFNYRLKARFPLTAQTPASSAYDYYNPDINGESAPQVLVVKDSGQ